MIKILPSLVNKHPFRALRVELLEDRRLLAAVSWINPAGGAWEVGSNWSNGTGPGSADDAVINVAGISVTHSSGSHSVKSLTSNDAFILSGGVLIVTGNLQEQNGNSFTNTNSFTLAGGTLASATVVAGTTITTLSGTLDGVTVNGNLDMTQQQTATLTILDGLVLNGTLSVGNATGSNSGLVTFGNGITANQSLSGSGTVLFYFGGRNSLINNDGSGGVLTIGSSVLIHGQSAAIYNTSSNVAIVNRGTISEDAFGFFYRPPRYVR